MKRVLIVNDGFPPTSWGGASTMSYLHAKGLLAKGYDVRVFAASPQTDAAPEANYEGIAVRNIYTNYHPRWWAYKSLYNKEVLQKFKEELENFRPDIVHFHNLHHYVSYGAISLAKKKEAKVFLTAHDVMSFAYQKLHHFIDYSSKEIPKSFDYYTPWWVNLQDARLRFNPFRNLIIRYYFRKLDKIFAVSEALKVALTQNGISNIVTVHNGIVFKSSVSNQIKEPVVLFVGRFTPDKGRDILLNAFVEILKSIPNAKLRVIGFPAGHHEPRMEQFIKENNLQSCIELLPAIPYSQMPSQYVGASLVVVPSIIFDSFPTANLEAMAAGKPVIATCFGGSSEAVEDGVTGFIINPLDIDSFVRKIILLLSDDKRAVAMGEIGYHRITKYFGISSMISEYEKQYK